MDGSGERAGAGNAMQELWRLSASEASTALARGACSAEALVESCLSRIAETEDVVAAWAYLDPALALKQARESDSRRRAGHARSPIDGLPVGIKDIFDTADMPTEDGSPLRVGRRPQEDSVVVSLLRKAGAIIMGKTVTTEFALVQPGKTANPHNPKRTPGGSSSGSAAAVASGMVPLAIGSQTVGSTIRPASYCGIFGYKPSFGRISRHGSFILCRQLDHVGLFSRDLEGLALLAEALMVLHPTDPDMRDDPPPKLSAALADGLVDKPRLAFCRQPLWGEVSEPARTAFTGFAKDQGATDVTLPESFDRAVDAVRTILDANLTVSLGWAFGKSPHQLSDALRARIQSGVDCSAGDYIRAQLRAEAVAEALASVMKDYDAIVTPAAPGVAPLGLGNTGNAGFCAVWTLLGLPAVSLPLLEGEEGMPLGVQLVGHAGGDAELFRVAAHILETIA